MADSRPGKVAPPCLSRLVSLYSRASALPSPRGLAGPTRGGGLRLAAWIVDRGLWIVARGPPSPKQLMTAQSLPLTAYGPRPTAHGPRLTAHGSWFTASGCQCCSGCGYGCGSRPSVILTPELNA
ncbi:hypothetical protein CC85DRAFT_119551 [Cutaneotrichosporon oleaginosum]|uniref:Uncharacterized protein n=1 Tax=Cutaneotrichosporon oleaginosum TaxID=879819 RepID=A0A0J0XK97_9TREE|nr:uncharacterized protein CC85DRAFT_119551 [Cutaneotrichosporon oleaginosum]KLT41492.1 hypothetical protein CC85DRAFT_119551 [Cutaneotrichosporon oleaginosum]TXT05858.1 hypothetical protein COLE_07178 [Cutaneotrichosporon oleaginosum]